MTPAQQTSVLQNLEAQGLFLFYADGNLEVTPAHLIKPETTETIKAHKNAIIQELRTRTAKYAADRADMARYYAEKMKAIDLQRQGKAFCGECLYWRSSDSSYGKGKCRRNAIVIENETATSQLDSCGEFIPFNNHVK